MAYFLAGRYNRYTRVRCAGNYPRPGRRCDVAARDIKGRPASPWSTGSALYRHRRAAWLTRRVEVWRVLSDGPGLDAWAFQNRCRTAASEGVGK